MKAIILAAGYATRLYPLTENCPKALLKIGSITILDFIVSQIETVSEINEIIIVTNNKFYTVFEEWKQCADSCIKITVINDMTTGNESRLGAIGDLDFAVSSLGINDDILVMASDNVFTFNLSDFYNYYEQKKNCCLIAKKIEDACDLKRMANIVLEGDRISHMVEKPQIPISNIAAFAVYIYTKETLPYIKKYLKEGNSKDAPGNFPAWLCQREPVYAWITEEECYDIGTVEAYNDIQKYADKLLGKEENK